MRGARATHARAPGARAASSAWAMGRMKSTRAWRCARWGCGEIFSATRSSRCFIATGVLWMARADNPYSSATEQTLRKTGVPFEIVPNEELARRYPQMRVMDTRVYGILEPRERSADGAARSGRGSGRRRPARRGLCQRGDSSRRREGGRRKCGRPRARSVRAEQFVFACGPWLPKIFPDLLGPRIYPTRQEVFFFAPPAGDRRFAPPQLPVWIDFADPRGPYGFPDLESRGFKLAFDRHGPPSTRIPAIGVSAAAGLEEARRFLAERFPDLAMRRSRSRESASTRTPRTAIS